RRRWRFQFWVVTSSLSRSPGWLGAAASNGQLLRNLSWVSACSSEREGLHASGRLCDQQVLPLPISAPPNMRLKLTGGDRSKGNGVLCPGGHELSFKDAARGGRVARSLSAIRWAAALHASVQGGPQDLRTWSCGV